MTTHSTDPSQPGMAQSINIYLKFHNITDNCRTLFNCQPWTDHRNCFISLPISGL